VALALLGCGGSGSSTGGTISPATTATVATGGISIAQVLAKQPTGRVTVNGNLFGFGATSANNVVFLCSGPGDPCVKPSLHVLGLDFDTAQKILAQQGLSASLS
jgi:hypothetical protein